MAKINVLNEHLANMIKAGEVIENPTSVVKELVENSLDAQATQIEIRLKEAGIALIEVKDNGIGMSEGDALLAFNRHATSKIKTEYDLFRIQTLGFRGEALPSIASCSKIVLQTKEEDAQNGIEVIFKAGKLLSKKQIGFNRGTIMTVSDLFYNTPARLKFLKAPNVILGQVSELIDKFALANPNVRFSLYNNDVVLLQTSGNNNYEELFGSIYGLNVAKNIHHLKIAKTGLKLEISFCNPQITKARKNAITIIVNKRIVKSYVILNAIMNAYKDYLPDGKYPICLINMDIEPTLIDCNVHPQKLEIKFSDEEDIYNFVMLSLLEGLKKIVIIPDQTYEKTKVDFRGNGNFFKNDNNVEPINYLSLFEHENLSQELKEEEMISYRLPSFDYIGALANSYLLFQNEDGLYLVDQHAAMERINYEDYLRILSNPETSSLSLLIPINLEFSKDEMLVLQKNMHLLTKYGFILEPSGVRSYFIREIPTWLNKDDAYDVVDEIIYYLIENNQFDITLLRNELAKKISCRDSIKANQYIERNEVEELMRKLALCQNPYNCPHGRPVLIKISTYEIEKRFKRVL